MTQPPFDDERDTRRPRWVAWAIGVVAVCIALGMLNLAWLMLAGALGPTVEKDTAAPADTASAPATAPKAALPLPATASSCLRCHGVERSYVGPAFISIAERYRDRADAPPYLAGKIVNGSVGEWGRVIMPRQVGITDATARDLAAWIMQLAPPAASAAQDASQSNPASGAAAR
jgi:cytochrome c